MLVSMRAFCACLAPAADAPCASKTGQSESESTCCVSPTARSGGARIPQSCHENICESHGARLEAAASVRTVKDDVYCASPFHSTRVTDTLVDRKSNVLSACSTVNEEVSRQQHLTPGTELASTTTTPLAKRNRWANDYHEGHLLPAQLNVDTSSLQHLLETGTLQGLHRHSCSTSSMHPYSAEHAKFPATRAQGTPTKGQAASPPLLAEPCTRPLASANSVAGQPDPNHGSLCPQQPTHNYHLSDCDSCHSTGITSGTENCSGYGPDSGGVLREKLVRLCAPSELIGDLSDLTPAALGTRSAVFSALWRGARVAVKFTTCASLDPQSSAIRQALLSKALSHPNVLQHYSVRCCHLAPADSPGTPPQQQEEQQQQEQLHPDDVSEAATGVPLPQQVPSDQLAAGLGCGGDGTVQQTEAADQPPRGSVGLPDGPATLVPVFHVVRDRCSNATANSAADATPGTVSPLGTMQDTDTGLTSHELGVAKGWELALSATAESAGVCSTGETMAQLPIAVVTSTYHPVDVQEVKGLQLCGGRQGQVHGQGHGQEASRPGGATLEMDADCFTLVANAVAVGTEEDGEQGGGALVGDLVMVRCAGAASGESPLEVDAPAARSGRVPQPHLQRLLASAAPLDAVRQGKLTRSTFGGPNEQGDAGPASGARNPAMCASAVPSAASAFTTTTDICLAAKATTDAPQRAAGAASPPAVSFNSFEGFGNPYGTGTMRHTLDHVAVLVAAREDDFMTAIIMEHADKGTLGAVVGKGLFRSNRVWSPRVALRALLRTALEIGCGLMHLHGRSIVHGALRPANVLLKSANLDRRGFTAKVANFSLARVCGGTSSCEAVGDLQGLGEGQCGGSGGGSSLPAGEVALALPYWSPEQLDGYVGKPTDVYAFGVTLYVMATGLLPYSGLAPAAIVSGVREGSLRPQWPPGPGSETMHPAVRELCSACWAHDPRTRPTFTQVCQQLQGIEHAVRQLLRPPPPAGHGGPSAGASNLSRCSWATPEGVPGGPRMAAQGAGGAGVVRDCVRG